VVPGDRLVGIMTPDTPIMIYPIHSDALSELYDSDVAWIDVRWDTSGREDRDYPCVISMQAQNKPGSLAQIATVIAACEANIHNLVMRMESPDFHRFTFQIEVRDLAQLTDVLNSLKLAAGISDVQRATVAEALALDRLEWTAPERQEEPA